MAEPVETHRTNFRRFVLANPNYFDNVVGTGIPPVAKLVEDTSFEQLTCVSFNPDLATLEATVVIKRPSGYGGDLCQTGTHEYVRFFVDYGSGFQDAGVASIEVHDIPDAKDCKGEDISGAHFDGAVGGGLVDDLQRMCPFGGLVIIGGLLLDPGSPYLGWTYQVQLSSDGLTWPGAITNRFTRTDNSFINHPVNPGPDGFFPFFSFQGNIGGTYAYWYTAGSDLWYMRLALGDPSHTVSYGPVMRVQLDNTAPVVDIHIDSGGDCKSFDVAAVLNGHFSAFDPAPSFFGGYRLRVLPNPLPGSMPPVPAPAVSPASGSVPTGSSSWTLNTAGMPRCGYVVVVDASDRSVVNSEPGARNYSGERAVGFCIKI